MNANNAKEVVAILANTHETAGALDSDIIYYLYVVDTDHELVGVVSLRDLIIASPDVVVQDIMSTRVVSVHDDMDQEDVGHVIKKYDLLAVPVLSKQNHLIGIV